MVGDDDEIERAVDAYARLGARMNDREALGEAIGGIDVGRRLARAEGVGRIDRVHVGIAPQQHSISRRCRDAGRTGQFDLERTVRGRGRLLRAAGQRQRGEGGDGYGV